MSLGGALGDAMAGVAHAAALSHAINHVHHERDAVIADYQEAIAGWKQHAADLQGQVAGFQERLAMYEEASRSWEQYVAVLEQQIAALQKRLASYEELSRMVSDNQRAQRHRDSQLTLILQRLEQRLARTQEALRNSSAASVALQKVHLLLCNQVQKVTDASQVPILNKERYRTTFEAARLEFLQSKRLSPSTVIEQTLRDHDKVPPYDFFASMLK